LHAEDPVEAIMTSPAICIVKDRPIGEALELMNDKEIAHLVITNDKGRVVGVLSTWDLMDVLGSSRFKNTPATRIYVSAVMSEPPVVVDRKDKITKAMKLMIENDFSFLPVVNEEHLPIGVVSETDMVRSLEPPSAPVKDLMKTTYPKVMPISRIVHARSIMLETGARILPVVEGGNFLGVVTERALARAFYRVRTETEVVHQDTLVRKILVEDVMNELPQTLNPSEDIRSAVDKFIEAREPALPVLGEKRGLLGVLERKSILVRIYERSP